MAVFKREIEKRAAVPQCVVEIPVASWSTTWVNRPSEPVKVGLRLISEADASSARAEAAKKALRYHPSEDDEDGRVEAYNGALMVAALGCAICDPDDVNASFLEWTSPTAQLAVSMTPTGIDLLYGHLDMFTMAESPSLPEATDEDVAEMATALLDGSAWKGMTGANAHRVKRLLAVCHGLMATIDVVST